MEKLAELILNDHNKNTSIGIQKEKTLHKYCKYYLCSDSKYHEIKIDNYYVDIYYNNQIYEIQTRSFNAFRTKITKLLENHQVTIVFPVAMIKTIYIVLENGVISKPRKSPKKGSPLSLCDELYKIKFLLSNPNLSYIILMADIDEYRYERVNRYKQKCYGRIDQVPTFFYDKIILNSPSDFIKLLPTNLEENFTTKDFARTCKLSKKATSTIVNVLHELGVITRIGKTGNAYIYKQNK